MSVKGSGNQRLNRADAEADYIILSFPRVAYDHTLLQRFAAEIIPKFA